MHQYCNVLSNYKHFINKAVIPLILSQRYKNSIIKKPKLLCISQSKFMKILLRLCLQWPHLTSFSSSFLSLFASLKFKFNSPKWFRGEGKSNLQNVINHEAWTFLSLSTLLKIVGRWQCRIVWYAQKTFVIRRCER